jgi:hypothetical protein
MGQLNAAHFVDLGRASSGAMVCATCSVRGFGWDGRNFCRQAAFLVVASWVFAPVFRARLFLLVLLCVGSSGNSCSFVLR